MDRRRNTMDKSQLQAIHARVPLISKSLGNIFLITLAAALAAPAAPRAAQQPDAPAPQPVAVSRQPQPSPQTNPAPGAPVRLTLQDALNLARKNDPTDRKSVV
jgi:hypothetical protein